ncbi:hypothetical protein GBAR_LOCUS29054 [Geodia barretti]|uniref:Uncharacterized protein n=1 Tax=Geodia barretti TaxID=519541 RepID=A0AA35TU51_GEOBA|nr:hypothetical protein GBAR_LOCUS29054 [Geodia barretti]
MQLGVRPATLSNIDASPLNDPLTCITKYLEAWLASEGPLSWDVIADVLSSAQLGKTALAARIKKTYCRSAGDPIADHAPCSPVSLDQLSESFSTTSEDGVPGAGGIELTTFVQPQIQLDPVEDPLPGLKPAPSPSRTKSKLNDQKLAKKVTSFKRRFRAIVISANVHLSQQMSRTDFDSFKIDLTTLPMLGKTHHFLQKERKKIRKAKSVLKVFEILDPYWNHVDYALLEHIVVHYCNEKIKRQMARYKHKLHRFEKATSVQRLKSVVTERCQIPSNYSALTVTLDMDGEECSLYHAREIKESITERANLEPYVTLLENLHSSSVVLTIAFPRTIRSHMEQTLPRIIVWAELGIVPRSLIFCDLDQQTSTFSRVRDFFVHNNNSRREEITYTVRHRDLNPRYKDLGPESVKILCEEIESEHSDQEVTLQFQWKSREIEFHICGLEEGVCTALQLLQQKVRMSILLPSGFQVSLLGLCLCIPSSSY